MTAGDSAAIDVLKKHPGNIILLNAAISGADESAGEWGDGVGCAGRRRCRSTTCTETNVLLEEYGRVARRAADFCKGIVFSNRPILAQGTGLGFTSHDPDTLEGSLPASAIPDMTQIPGNWVKTIDHKYAREGAVLHYYVNDTGDMFFGAFGKDRGLLMKGVNTTETLWAVIDIYGYTTAVEMVGRGLRRAFRGGRHDALEKKLRLHVEEERAKGHRVSREDIQTKAQQLALRGGIGRSAFEASRGRGWVMNCGASSDDDAVCGSDQREVVARRPSGHVRRCQVAERCDQSKRRAYAFLSRPLVADERLLVQVAGVQPSLSGSLSFGLTTCDPASLEGKTAELPSQLEDLLDRPEYWVFQIGIPCGLDDKLVFVTRKDGASPGRPQGSRFYGRGNFAPTVKRV
ncbi:hypothetical protein HPB48_017677 [Haemaphysalis longicornis]|uniref:NHR domain-containing protein n=1 Tax=Haemaphysalis longicornis TaxID=44386 RepID=A0A9J6FKB1_HAELO|nr:hypothetical protein HPB48_017677 [Haemaphysalis longicornis]